MITLGALILTAGLCAPQDQEVSADVAREWRVRALALGQEAWPEERSELDWEERCDLLDAARRADPSTIDERAASFVMESLSHEHSNVRALALAAARRCEWVRWLWKAWKTGEAGRLGRSKYECWSRVFPE